MNFKSLLIAGLTVAAMSGAASASPLPFYNCSVTQGGGKVVQYGLSQDETELVATYCQSGNDENTVDGFGWMLGDDVDDPSDPDPGGDGKLTLTINDDNSWSLLNPFGYSELGIALKQGNSFAFYLLDTDEPLTGHWFTSGPGTGDVDDPLNVYSHINAWYLGDPGDDTPPIPLPAAGWMLLAGIGGLAAYGRRRRKAS